MSWVNELGKVTQPVIMIRSDLSFYMKLLFLFPLLLLASCSTKLHSKDFSFEITDKVVSSNLQKDDDDSSPIPLNSGARYKTCDRKGNIAWELSIKPDNFSGIVIAEGVRAFGDYKEEKKVFNFYVVEGKMFPTYFYISASSLSDPERLSQVCNFTDAKKLSIDIDQDTVFMIPGVKPLHAKSSTEIK